LTEHEKILCAEDPVHFTNSWLWTYDPRRQPSCLPFNLFPRQAELLRWLAERESRQEHGLIEKSRDMDVTFLCCAYALHHWLFRSGFSAGFGSRKLELVDRLGDMDSIFEKIRYLLYNLPAWMLPRRFKRDLHDNVARLINPNNEASVTGEGGDNIGRGGRKSIYFIDEAAFIENADTIERSLSQTTNIRIDLSTPNGPGNPFYTKRSSANVAVFTFHWRDDPRKGDAWYAEQKKRLDPVALAQEVDLDYSASVEGICIPAAWVRAAVGLPLLPSGKTVCGFDVGEEGPDYSVLMPRQGPVVGEPASWRGLLTTESAWKAKEEAQRMGAALVSYDCIGIGVSIKGTWNTAERPLPFQANAVNVGEAPSDHTYWPDGRTSKEKFINLRAELWWKLRTGSRRLMNSSRTEQFIRQRT
jgi:hypothetical protein